MNNKELESSNLPEALIGLMSIEKGIPATYQFLYDNIFQDVKEELSKVDKTDYIQELKVVLKKINCQPEFKSSTKKLPKKYGILVDVFVEDEVLFSLILEISFFFW